MMTNEDILARQQRAEDLFRSGFNCSQAVFAACADLYHIDEDTALRLSASFGGGIGRMRQTCGAACGMFLLEGLQSGSHTPHDTEGKKHNYEQVQNLAARFRQENGSLICAELLGLTQPERTAQPEARTEAYYKKRPCVETVRTAVRIFCEQLNNLTT